MDLAGSNGWEYLALDFNAGAREKPRQLEVEARDPTMRRGVKMGILSRELFILAVCGTASAPFASIFQGGSGTTSGSGYPQVPGTSVFRDKVFTNNFYRPTGASGTVLHNVNTLTGQPVYSVPLTSIEAGSISYTVALTYSGPVRETYAADNQAGATSWIGYGWSLSAPFVAANHMGTTNNLDDIFYCNLGPYGGGQLLQKAIDQYYVATDPTIQVSLQRDADGNISRWYFLTSNGIRLTMGSNAGDASRTVNHYASFISATPFSTSLATNIPYTYRWDISRIEEYGQAVVPTFPALEFYHSPIQVTVGYNASSTAKTYTRESYLREIVRKDSKGNRVESLVFETSPKVSTEYSARSFAPTVSQEMYETRYLSRISRYTEDKTSPDVSYILTTRLQSPDANLMYTKRFLDEVRFEYPNPRGGVLAESKMRWGFTYETDPIKHFALKTVLKPFFGKDEFEYDRPSYQVPAWNQATGQESVLRKVSSSGGTEIQLPSDPNLVLQSWENQTQCSERFCFVAVSEKIPAIETMYFEVWKNNGNYFELVKRSNGQYFRTAYSSQQTGAPNLSNRIKVMPWGDNFIVVDSKDANFWLYEWNGTTFNEYNESILTGRTLNRGDNEYIDIHLGNDFFLVEDGGYTFKDCNSSIPQSGTKYYVVKKIDGEWKELNQGAACDLPVDRSSCTVDFPSNYGESNYLAAGCLAMRLPGKASAGTGQFHIAHPTGMIFPFFQNPGNTGFTSKGNLIADFDPAVQKAGYPMNWEGEILGPIQIGTDYFLIKSQIGSTVRIDVMHYTGSNIMRIGGVAYSFSSSQQTDLADVKANLRASVSGDYFITTSAILGKGAQVFFKRVSRDINGIPTQLWFDGPGTLLTDLPRESEGDIRVATGPYSFSIEAYPNGKAPGNMTSAAPLLDGAGQYRSYLYQVNPSETAPFSQLYNSVTPSLYSVTQAGVARRLFNFSFSSADNLLTARYCISAANTNCQGAESDKASFYTAKLNPWKDPAGTNFVRELKSVYNPWTGTSYSNHYSKFDISNSGKLAAVCMLNTQSQRIEFALLQHSGTGFTQYPYQITFNSQPWADLNFVTKFKSYGDISGQGGGRWTEYVFKYTPSGSPFLAKNPEFNSHVQSFIFPNMSVYGYQGSESMSTPAVVGSETISHIIDESGAPLAETHLIKQGSPTERRLDDMKVVQGVTQLEKNMSKTLFEYYDPQRESTWPENLYVSRLKKTTATQYDRNGSTQTQVTTYHKYHPVSNSPLFTKANVAGKWRLGQTLFYSSGTNQGIPAGHNSFIFTTEPSDAALEAWPNPGNSYDQDNAFEKLVSAGRLEFDANFPFLAKKNWVWKDEDPTLTNEELKKGDDPIYSLAEGWQERDIVEKRNSLGQVLESRVLLNASGSDRRTVQVYEGRASLPVARFENAYYEDVAALTGENFNVASLNTHDWQGRWIKADAGATELISHSGRASIKVVSNSGPKTDLFLKGVQGQGYDYIVSAWIYCLSGTTPALKVERLRSDGTSFGSQAAIAPVGTALVTNRWQRYEMRLSNSVLRGNNLFTGTSSGDVLRVSVGTLGSGTIYVDDIVCRPSTATYSLQAFDGRQRIIHSQDMNHNMVSYEYDLFGNATAVRDDKHRIFTSTAGHQPGEND
jgi:hypothetical protein